MALSNRVVDANLVVSSVTDEGGKWSWDLVEQGLNLRAIVNIATGQLRCEDLAGLGVDADVQLAPGSTSPGTVFLDQPLAGSAQTQACAVDQRVNRSFGGGQGCRTSRVSARRLRVE